MSANIVALHLRVVQCAIVGINDKEEQHRCCEQSGMIVIQSCDCVQPDQMYCVIDNLDELCWEGTCKVLTTVAVFYNVSNGGLDRPKRKAPLDLREVRCIWYLLLQREL